MKNLRQEGMLKVEIGGEMVEISEDMLDIRIVAKEGFNVQTAENLFVILDTHLTEELINEGLVREVVSRVQQLRKNSGFEVTDRIDLYVSGAEEVKRALQQAKAYIQKETLADEVFFTDESYETFNINGYDSGLQVVRK